MSNVIKQPKQMMNSGYSQNKLNKDSYKHQTSSSHLRKTSKVCYLPDILDSLHTFDNNNHVPSTSATSTKLPELNTSIQHHSKNLKKNRNCRKKNHSDVIPGHLLREKWKRVNYYNKRETKNMKNTHEKHISSDVLDLYPFLQPTTASLQPYISIMIRGKRTNKNVYPKLDESEQDNNSMLLTQHGKIVPIDIQLMKLPVLQRLRSVTDHSTMNYNKRFDSKPKTKKTKLVHSASVQLLDSQVTTDEYITSVIHQVRKKQRKNFKTVVKKLGGAENEYHLALLRRKQKRREKKFGVLNRFKTVAASLIVPENVVQQNLYRQHIPAELREKFLETHRTNLQITFDTITDWMVLQKFFSGWKTHIQRKKSKQKKFKDVHKSLKSKSLTMSNSYRKNDNLSDLNVSVAKSKKTNDSSPTVEFVF